MNGAGEPAVPQAEGGGQRRGGDGRFRGVAAQGERRDRDQVDRGRVRLHPGAGADPARSTVGGGYRRDRRLGASDSYRVVTARGREDPGVRFLIRLVACTGQVHDRDLVGLHRTALRARCQAVGDAGEGHRDHRHRDPGQLTPAGPQQHQVVERPDHQHVEEYQEARQPQRGQVQGGDVGERGDEAGAPLGDRAGAPAPVPDGGARAASDTCRGTRAGAEAAADSNLAQQAPGGAGCGGRALRPVEGGERHQPGAERLLQDQRTVAVAQPGPAGGGPRSHLDGGGGLQGRAGREHLRPRRRQRQEGRRQSREGLAPGAAGTEQEVAAHGDVALDRTPLGGRQAVGREVVDRQQVETPEQDGTRGNVFPGQVDDLGDGGGGKPLCRKLVECRGIVREHADEQAGIDRAGGCLRCQHPAAADQAHRER